jgi:hypothetical protein
MENEMANFVRDCKTLPPSAKPGLDPNTSALGPCRNEAALACFQSPLLDDKTTASIGEHFEINL